MFNALDLMENKEFLEKLKFGIGDGNLQYYLYNWKCPYMEPTKVSYSAMTLLRLIFLDPCLIRRKKKGTTSLLLLYVWRWKLFLQDIWIPFFGANVIFFVDSSRHLWWTENWDDLTKITHSFPSSVSLQLNSNSFLAKLFKAALNLQVPRYDC